MKRQAYILIFFVSLFYSCSKDFLDVNNTEQLFRESYVKDLTSTEEYLRGVYYNLSFNVESGESNSTYPELVADNLRPLSGTSSPATSSHYNWTQEAVVSAARNLNLLWKSSYMTIRMCSFIIDNVDKYRGEGPEWADNIKGQALAVRALIYFKLINIFAQPYTFTAEAGHPGVPYITTSDITQSYTRQSVNEVYDGMISDLLKAIGVLPETVADTRYMNRTAAKALLARVYLFKEDFTNAKKLAEEVVNLVPLLTTAAGYPNDIFKLKAPANTETLFQLTPLSPNSLGRWVRRSPVKFCATTDVAGMLMEYPNDIRRSWVKDTVVSGSKFQLIKKFPIAVTPEFPLITNPDLAYYTPVLRSSEMALTAAEAAARTGDENTARSYLNAIRKRADPSIAEVNASGVALIDSIYRERRKELSFEGLRMFDLQRWKIGVLRTDVLPGSPNKLAYPNNKAISPIPLDEVRLVGMSQNDSY
jgi:starch-binding outer membrane protein, SusD/RagB family